MNLRYPHSYVVWRYIGVLLRQFEFETPRTDLSLSLTSREETLHKYFAIEQFI